MFRRLINSQSKTITSAAIVIGALSLVSRFLGIFRDRILAAQFGAGDILDVYYAAFRLPDLVYNILILGAVSAGLIPVFTSLLARHKEDDAWKLINSILNLLAVGLVVVCAILFISAPWLMKLITPGFSPEKMNMVVNLSRVMFLSPLFLGLSAIFSSILQSFKKFFIFSLAPIFYNVGIIIGVLFFVKPWGIYGLAWGVVLGSVFHLLIQITPIFSVGYKYAFDFNWRDKNVLLVSKLMVPRTITLVLNQINFLVITVVASTLATGSLAIFNLANNLQSFPLGIFGVSLAVAALPVLSALAAEKKMADFVSAFSATFRQALFFIVPISVLLFVLRAQVVRVILGSGSFNWYDTRLTAASLAIFCVSLFAQGVFPLLIRGFYAIHNTKTPFFINLFSLALNFAALFFFRWVFSFENGFSFFVSAMLHLSDLKGVVDLRVLALPLAFSAAAIFDMVLLMIWLRKYIGRLDGRKIMSSTFRIIFASLGSGLFAFGTLRLINYAVITETFAGIFIQGVAAGLVGLFGYWVIGYLLNMEEMAIFVGSMKRRLFKTVKFDKASIDEGVNT